jgi:hypothetical protein
MVGSVGLFLLWSGLFSFLLGWVTCSPGQQEPAYGISVACRAPSSRAPSCGASGSHRSAPRLAALPRRIYLNNPSFNLLPAKSSNVIISAPRLAALHRRIYLNNPSFNLLPAKSSNVMDPPLTWLHSLAEFTLNNPSNNLHTAISSNVIDPSPSWLHSLAEFA